MIVGGKGKIKRRSASEHCFHGYGRLNRYANYYYYYSPPPEEEKGSPAPSPPPPRPGRGGRWTSTRRSVWAVHRPARPPAPSAERAAAPTGRGGRSGRGTDGTRRLSSARAPGQSAPCPRLLSPCPGGTCTSLRWLRSGSSPTRRRWLDKGKRQQEQVREPYDYRQSP